jgi:hypothetical protein
MRFIVSSGRSAHRLPHGSEAAEDEEDEVDDTEVCDDASDAARARFGATMEVGMMRSNRDAQPHNTTRAERPRRGGLALGPSLASL